MNLIQILFTPNEVLNNIFTCIFAFIEAFLFCKLFTQLLHIESTKLQKAIYIILAPITVFVINYFLENPYIYLMNFTVFILFLHMLFRQDLRNCFIALITTYISIFISAFSVQIFFNGLLKITSEQMINIPIYHFLASSLIYFIFFFFFVLINKIEKIRIIAKVSIKSTIIINLILGIVTIFIQSYVFSLYTDSFPLIIKIVTILSLIIYFLISMYSLIRTKLLEQTKQELETEKLYNKTLNLLHDNIRCFKHDFNNIVQAIGGYIALNDMDGLKKYYKQLLEDCKQTNNLNILNPETVNNPSIYSLLNNKYYLASEKGITMTFNIFTDLSKINFNIYEFTRILGILLDNAIEAAQETNEKIINIEFRNDSKKQLFIIENSCTTDNISITKIFEKGYSTKKLNSGIGLWKVHNILSKNTNIDLFTTVQNHMFKQQLEVFYN